MCGHYPHSQCLMPTIHAQLEVDEYSVLSVYESCASDIHRQISSVIVAIDDTHVTS